MNPDYLPPNRRQTAQAAARVLRAAQVRRRLATEAWGVLSGLQEALRTAGVVLAVLAIVGLHPWRPWLVSALFLGPFLVNSLELAVVLVLARRKPIGPGR